MEDLINIPNTEKTMIKTQILEGLRRKYLQHKADLIIGEALKDVRKKQEAERLMNDTVTAYTQVEAEL